MIHRSEYDFLIMFLAFFCSTYAKKTSSDTLYSLFGYCFVLYDRATSSLFFNYVLPMFSLSLCVLLYLSVYSTIFTYYPCGSGSKHRHIPFWAWQTPSDTGKHYIQ